MIQRLIHSARVNVFESTRFYYWLILFSVIFSFFKGILNKWVYVHTSIGNEIQALKIISGCLYAMVYFCLICSALFFYRLLEKKAFFYWLIIVIISTAHELNYAVRNLDYDLFYSFTYSQGYFYIKFTLPILFFGVWPALKANLLYGGKILDIIAFLLKINACFIILGALMNLSIMESYPLSGRWGYSGLLYHKSLNNILYGIFLIRHWSSNERNFITTGLYITSLLLLGQKASFLYLLLFVSLVIIKNKTLRVLLVGGAVGGLAMASYWVPFVVKFNPFWHNVYEKYGSLGVVLSLRNENVSRIFESPGNMDFVSIIFGGISRYPKVIEMFPFDVFIYFGLAGLISSLIFYKYWIPNLKVWIPIIVGIFSGVIYELILGMILLGVWAEEEKKKSVSMKS